MRWRNQVLLGDCIEVMAGMPDACIDLAVTSPPYVEQRRQSYPGVPEHEYPEFTSRWMASVRRLLKRRASVAIVIRENQGAQYRWWDRSVDRLLADGWVRHDRKVWFKPDGPPLGDPLLPRRAFEWIDCFSLTEPPYTRREIDTDVLVAAVAGNHRARYNTHTAQFPEVLARQIIEILSARRATILDPFCGGGSTLVAARALGRSFVGIDIQGSAVNIARKRIKEKVEAGDKKGYAGGSRGSREPGPEPQE